MHTLIIAFVGATMGACLNPEALHAQNELQSRLTSLPTNTRVRLTVNDSLRAAPFGPRAAHLIGRLVRTSGDTLFVVPAGAVTPTAVVLESVRRAERSRGASALRSAVQQSVLAGISFALLTYSGQPSGERKNGEILAWGATVASVGALLGAVRPYEQWQRVRP